MALSVVYFQIMHRLGRPHYMWDEYLFSVWEKVDVRMAVSVTVCVLLLILIFKFQNVLCALGFENIQNFSVEVSGLE